MSLNPEQELIKASAALANGMQETWKNFLVTLRGYTEETKNRLVSAPRDVIERTQGQAQQCQIFLDLFVNAVQTADRMKTKQK